MSQMLMISDELHARLEATAAQRGFSSIEQLLETWQANEDRKRQRQAVVREIDALRQRLFETYGPMPSSVNLIREDREREA
jgi:hypothetical protein